MKISLLLVTIFTLLTFASCKKDSEKSGAKSGEGDASASGICTYDLEICHVKDGKTSSEKKPGQCKNTSESECETYGRLMAGSRSWCFDTHAKEGDERWSKVNFKAGSTCENLNEGELEVFGACTYKKEICHVDSEGNINIETKENQCENISEKKCTLLRQLGAGSRSWCFDTHAEEGAERITDVEFDGKSTCK